jgi:hypothetical protein
LRWLACPTRSTPAWPCWPRPAIMSSPATPTISGQFAKRPGTGSGPYPDWMSGRIYFVRLNPEFPVWTPTVGLSTANVCHLSGVANIGTDQAQHRRDGLAKSECRWWVLRCECARESGAGIFQLRDGSPVIGLNGDDPAERCPCPRAPGGGGSTGRADPRQRSRLPSAGPPGGGGARRGTGSRWFVADYVVGHSTCAVRGAGRSGDPGPLSRKVVSSGNEISWWRRYSSLARDPAGGPCRAGAGADGPRS